MMIDLSEYQISRKTGFLLESPCCSLPPLFDPWMDVSSNVHVLIRKGCLRNAVKELPMLPINSIRNNELELRLAHLLLSTISSGYIWCEGEENVPRILPANIAVPLHEVSTAIGIPPIVCHATFGLANCKLVDPDGAYNFDNLKMISAKFIADPDVDGFFLITAQIEQAFAPALRAIVEGMDCQTNADTDRLLACMENITETLSCFGNLLETMKSHVDPVIFYHKIRPFLAGYKSGLLGQWGGIIFEGVREEPIKLTGGSAGQSATLHSVDAFLGIEHSASVNITLDDMKCYMPPKHAAFVDKIKELSIIRNLACPPIKTAKSELIRAQYNLCINSLAAVRSVHIRIVTSYIVIAKHKLTNSEQKRTEFQFLKEEGTGGTPIMPFLKSLRDTTLKHLL